LSLDNKGDVLTLGIVESDAKHLAGVSGAFEDGTNEGVLISINRLDLVG